MDIVTSILEMIVLAFTTVVTGIGTSVNDMFTSIFLTGSADTGYSLSPIAAWGVSFFAIGLVLSLLWTLLRKVV